MFRLRRHRVAVVIGLGIVFSLPATVRVLRDDRACLREIRAAWPERLRLLAGLRACPSGEP